MDIPGLSMDGHSYSQLSTKQLCPSMDGRGLSTAPLDISVSLSKQLLALMLSNLARPNYYSFRE